MGAAWYLLSIDRHLSCWKSICNDEKELCKASYLDCSTINDIERKKWAEVTNVFKGCTGDDDLPFKYGIFQNAVQKNVISSSIFHKYFYCLWWGLQQLRYVFLLSLFDCLFGLDARNNNVLLLICLLLHPTFVIIV